MDFAARFENGLSYLKFLEQYGTAEQQSRWAAIHSQIVLTPPQVTLLQSFTRDMKVLVVAGAWCGDCVNQCPVFHQFSEISPQIQVRFFDRDVDADLAAELMICGGCRVPTLLFLSEDGYVCGRYGDRTLSKYRDMAATQAGAACPAGIGEKQPLLEQVTQDWLDEFERIQLMLRLSGRLRKRHGD
ncbi:MAG: thioredoxin family protein [Planctomycetaceae bacterium]